MTKEKTEIETEMKIKASPDDLEKLFRLLKKRAIDGKMVQRHTPRFYYDTPDLKLYNQGVSIRVQYTRGDDGATGGHEQTLTDETAPANQGVLTRKEVKNTLPSHLPDLKKIRDAEAKKKLAGIKSEDLVHIFTASIERRLFNIKAGKNGKVEVAFDVGSIYLPSPSKDSSPLMEVEIEIKQGSAALIDEVKKEILKIAPKAKVQPMSKADQGVALYKKHKGKKR